MEKQEIEKQEIEKQKIILKCRPKGGLCCTKIENFTVKAGKVTILDNINLHIHCRELTALIGPNGAGKSTLLKAIMGEIKHDGNLIYLDEKGVHSGKPIIGYVPQNLEFDTDSPVSVMDLFQAASSKRPSWLGYGKETREKVEGLLGLVKAEGLADKRLGDLSGGELQRVLLALSLNPMPDILLLDEPVSGVDRNGLEIFYELLFRIKTIHDLTIILISHDLELVRKHADRIVLLNKKIVLNGYPEEVMTNPLLYSTFGLPLPTYHKQTQ